MKNFVINYAFGRTVDKLAELLLLNTNWRLMWLRMWYQYAEFKQLAQWRERREIQRYS